MLKPFIQKAIDRIDLNRDEATTAAHIIMRGDATEAQIGAWLACMRLKGESEDEILGIATAMRENAITIAAPGPATVDTCGTGGDGLSTFNISTAAALVTAAAGVVVAKHGNRSVSSRCGSADVLETLGIDVDPGAAVVEQCLREHGFAFMFAPRFHPAMKHVVGPRREIAVRTVFNILGPLTNPAGVTRQVIGLYARERMRPIARVLHAFGAEHVLVVQGSGGADELLPTGTCYVVELRNGDIAEYELDPANVGVATCRLTDLVCDNADASARILTEMFDGRPGPPAEAVALNAGAALYVAGNVTSIADGVARARQVLTERRVPALLETLRSAHRAPAE